MQQALVAHSKKTVGDKAVKLPGAMQGSMERLHQTLTKFLQVVAGPLWPRCPCVPLLKSERLFKPEQVTRQQLGASLQGQHIPCPALRPLPSWCPSTIMAAVPPAAAGLLTQPRDQAPPTLLLHTSPPSCSQHGHPCEAELNLSPPESLSNMNLTPERGPPAELGSACSLGPLRGCEAP